MSLTADQINHYKGYIGSAALIYELNGFTWFCGGLYYVYRRDSVYFERAIAVRGGDVNMYSSIRIVTLYNAKIIHSDDQYGLLEFILYSTNQCVL